jgi:hypothetical protein
MNEDWEKRKAEVAKLEEKKPLKYVEKSIALLEVFKQFYNPRSALYPLCGYNASPIRVFENVTFLDSDPFPMKKMRALGYNAICQDIETYNPAEKHDLIILELSTGIPEKTTRTLGTGGYIIADNSWEESYQINKMPEFELIGCIENPNTRFSDNIEGLLEPVANFEELKTLNFDEYQREMTEMASFKEKMITIGALKTNQAITPEELYLALESEYKTVVHLPFKRIADRYIFIKK